MIRGGHIASTEGEQIIIENDCMFSNDIEIRNGDSHSIKTGTEERTNWAESVVISDYVWLTAHVQILKGSTIPSHSIVANSSVITHKLNTPYSIYGGNPVKLLKTGMDKYRNRYKFERK